MDMHGDHKIFLRWNNEDRGTRLGGADSAHSTLTSLIQRSID
jgi:hypothetical protein